MKLIASPPDTRIALEEHYSFRPLLSGPESQLHAYLNSLVGTHCHIVCKPRLADFIQHHDGLGGFNRISQKHVDFLVCRKEDWMPMLAIELEDPAHSGPDRHSRDTFINDLFSYIGIPLVRLHVTELSLMDQFVRQLEAAWNRRCVSLSLRATPHMAYS